MNQATVQNQRKPMPQTVTTIAGRSISHFRRAVVIGVILLATSAGLHAQTGSPAPFARPQYFDDSGNPCASCTIDTFVTGASTTPLSTYSDAGLTTPNANPIVLDGSGRAQIFLTPALTYRFVFKTAAGATIWTQDGINGHNAADIDRLRLRTHTVTLASDAFTATYSQYAVDTEGGAASDNLSNIVVSTGVSAGFLMVLTPANVAHVVTVKHNSGGGNIRLGSGDYAMDATGKSITLYYDGSNWIEQARSGSAGTITDGTCDGRVTAQTGVAIPVNEVTAATTIYFTPYKGNRCALYDGTSWNMRTFSEVSLSLGADAANTNYDLFAFDSGGTLTLERTAWTNDTTRATALTTQDGVLVRTGATTRRYLGTYRTTGTVGQTEDSLSKRFVWSFYNRTIRTMRRNDATDTWTYTTATWRQANASTANQLDFVAGIDGVPMVATTTAYAINSTGNISVFTGIGYDSTSAILNGSEPGLLNTSSVQAGGLHGHVSGLTTAGRHFLAWLEYSVATGTTTWIGDNGAATIYQAGIFGWIEG